MAKGKRCHSQRQTGQRECVIGTVVVERAHSFAGLGFYLANLLNDVAWRGHAALKLYTGGRQISSYSYSGWEAVELYSAS